MRNRGCFVVLEGIDGSGTTTQCKALRDRLTAMGIPARTTREPSDGPIGTMIRQVLTGRMVVPGGKAPGWATMALLFAADRVDHVEAEIAPGVEAGYVVISDRYDASSLAYQSATSGGDPDAIEWIRSLNQKARRPDLTIVVSLTAEKAAERRRVRGEPAELYEQSELQRRLVEFYAALPEHMQNDLVVMVDGDGPIEVVAERILAEVLRVLGR